jgi:aminoglycoside 3-N-acetyltransferase I
LPTDVAAVRRLGPADLPALRQLNVVFAEAFDDAASYASAPPDDAWSTALLAREHVVVLAAERDGAVVGGLVAYELDKFEQARRELYIYDLAVAEPHRRRGIARALIEELRAIARERKVWVIYVQADLEDDPAIRLYQGLGTREDVLHFDIAPAEK